MVSVAPLKSLNSFSMSCLVSWAPRVRWRQCLASSLEVSWQPVDRLSSFRLFTSKASHSKLQAERFLMKVLYSRWLSVVTPTANRRIKCHTSNLTASWSHTANRAAALPFPVAEQQSQDIRRSFSSSAVALNYSRAHGKQVITLWCRKDTHEDLPKLIAHICDPCCCSSCLVFFVESIFSIEP